MFRQKTLFVEDPVFLNDAEQQFGETLVKWKEQGADAVIAAALELKVAEQRLVHATGRAADGPHAALLDALDALMTLSSKLTSARSELFPEAVELIWQAVLYLGSAYLGGSDGPKGMASLAAVLVSHAGANPAAITLVQPSPGGVLPLLEGIASGGRVAPQALMQVLAQCDFQSLSGADAPSVVSSLCVMIPLMAQDGPEAAHACATVHSLVATLAERSPEACEAAVGGLVEALLATSKGVSCSSMRQSLGMADNASLDTVSVQGLLDWIFSTTPELVKPHTVAALLQSISWAWLASTCPAPLRLRWLAAAVAGAKLVAKFGTDGSGAVKVLGVADQLTTPDGWSMCCLGAEQSEDDAYLMCMLEVRMRMAKGGMILSGDSLNF